MKYNPKKLEKKWSAVWQKKKVYEPDLRKAKKPFYTLMMFPYPSAEGLHIGGVRTFTGVDIYGRFKRMQGFDVFEPIGLDGFGIHSENYAMKINRHPMKLAKKTEKNFYAQLSYIGNGFAWNERLETYDPEYYRWTQWLFVRMFRRGLAYRKKASVNWCPSCMTVLADEQVISGACERCGMVAIKKELEQWFFKITEYAERLLKNIDSLDWSRVIKTAQEHWIGKSEGAEIDFKIIGIKDRVTVFTTRPDTLFGATYLVLAPEHPLLKNQELKIKNQEEVKRYSEDAKNKAEADRIAEGREKTGVALDGVRALNPATGEEIPVYIADYVLGGYGTGAIMAVPAHDDRDLQFALKFKLSVKPVIAQVGSAEEAGVPGLAEAKLESIIKSGFAHMGSGFLINSGKFNSLSNEEAKKKIVDFVGGTWKIQYRIRDWLISRQRYWGPPIPMINCPSCGWVPVPEKDLPVKLPFIKDFRPKGTGESPLASVGSFYKVKCPQCRSAARRETDVSDTFLDSAWYFFRYIDVKNKKQAFDAQRAKKWLPVDMYIGGAEHAVLHLLYTRFVTMALHDLNLVEFEEPFKTFRAHGLITKDGAKMSKSKGNVVSPDDYFSTYGADTMRMYLAFLAPFTEGGDFRDAGISGITRFLNRVWNAAYEKVQGKNSKVQSDPLLQKKIHQAIKKVTEDIEALRYNTAISALMVLLNAFEEKAHAVTKKDVGIFLKLLAPFAPFIAEELWALGAFSKKKGSIHCSAWPVCDERMLVEDTHTIVVQVNGKVRDQVDVPAGASQKEVEKIVLQREKVIAWTKGASVKKIIFVPKKLMNIVAA